MRGRYDSVISFNATPEIVRELEGRKMVEFVGDYKPGEDNTAEYQFLDYPLLNEAMAIALKLRDDKLKAQAPKPPAPNSQASLS